MFDKPTHTFELNYLFQNEPRNHLVDSENELGLVGLPAQAELILLVRVLEAMFRREDNPRGD